MTLPVPRVVESYARSLPVEQLPAYVYDLSGLQSHAARIREALPSEIELQYVAKANGDVDIVRTLSSVVDRFEGSSRGEIERLTEVADRSVSFGAPGKTVDELGFALEAGVDRFHVESMTELYALGYLARKMEVRANVLLRMNLPLGRSSGNLVMGGAASPFGFDPAGLPPALDRVRSDDHLVFKGLHAHLASGLDVEGAATVASTVVEAARSLAVDGPIEVNVGGGMEVDYTRPNETFDWERYGNALAELVRVHGDAVSICVEPGRSVTAYCGWYVTRVLDVRESFGESFVIIAGGTHHLRTPVAKGHDQPFAVLPVEGWDAPWARSESRQDAVTIVGQLCTPKDVLARNQVVGPVRAGDLLAFGMAGAYAWNISHRAFLMHPEPTMHYLTAV